MEKSWGLGLLDNDGEIADTGLLTKNPPLKGSRITVLHINLNRAAERHRKGLGLQWSNQRRWPSKILADIGIRGFFGEHEAVLRIFGGLAMGSSGCDSSRHVLLKSG